MERPAPDRLPHRAHLLADPLVREHAALLIDAVAYACYLFFLSKAEENMGKLWFAFILAYVLASSDKLAIVWQMLAANAGTH